jgi:hypothetical protein
MANFAKLDDNNIVIEVLGLSNDVVNNLPFPESESLGIAFLNNLLGENANWKQTSYNRNFRKHLASIGYFYDPTLDAFISPKYYPSWHLNTNTCEWDPPVPYPTDGKIYNWNEETQQWVEITGE